METKVKTAVTDGAKIVFRETRSTSAVIEIHGDLRACNSDELKLMLMRSVESAAWVIVDLSNATSIDQRSARVLRKAERLARRLGKPFSIAYS